MKIDIEKIKEELVDAELKKAEIDASGKLVSKVRKLQAHYKKTIEAKNMSAPCSECGCESDLNLAACPFCGAEGVSEEPLSDVVNKPVDKPKASPPDKPPVSTEVVETTGTDMTDGGLPSLEESESAIRAAHVAGVGSYYDLGKALGEIFSKNLWKHRLGPDGKPIYRGWNQYVSTVHDITPKHSYEIIETSRYFSREDFVLVGVDRLRQILRFDSPQQRAELVEAAKGGNLTRAKLREFVAENPPPRRGTQVTRDADENGNASTGFRGGKEGAAKGSAARKKPKPPEGEVTAVATLGRVKIPLFARPKKKGLQPLRAMKVEQDPMGEEQLLNGVIVHYRIVRDTKGLSLIVERVREAAKE